MTDLTARPIQTTKNPAFLFGSRVGENYGRDTYPLPTPPLFVNIKWAGETQEETKPPPRIEDRIVPADGLMLCGLLIRIKNCSASFLAFRAAFVNSFLLKV
jgi:hypothetical protein